MLSPVLQAEIREAELIGLPLAQRDRESWEATLETYAELYVENEIRQESIVRDMGAFIRFLSVAALESGRWVNYTKMAAAVGVSVNTLRSFYQVLEDTFLGFRVPSFATTRKRLMSATRFVFFDLGVRHKLANLHVTPDLIRTQAGELFEQWVMSECIPVEIKWTERPTPSDARHVDTFLDLHQETSRRGYVICRCPSRQKFGDRVTALPWNVF